MAIEGEGAAGAGAGGESGKAGAGAAGAGAGGQGGASGASEGTPSLIGGAGAKKEGAAGAAGAGGEGKGGDEAAKAASEKAAAEKATAVRTELEKTLAKDLEGKTAEEKKAILDKKVAEKLAAEQAGKDGKQGAPEEYTDFKLPEGFDIDQPAMKGFKDLAKSMNLSQEAAQKLVDFQSTRERDHAQAAVTEFESTVKSWREETQKKYGANFETEQSNVGRFLEQFGSPELRKLMDATRVGENVHLFDAMAKAGAKLSEGNMPDNGGNTDGKQEQGKRWYPNMRKQLDAAPAK